MDNFRRTSFYLATLIKIIVFGENQEIILLGKLPNGKIICKNAVGISDMPGALKN